MIDNENDRQQKNLFGLNFIYIFNVRNNNVLQLSDQPLKF